MNEDIDKIYKDIMNITRNRNFYELNHTMELNNIMRNIFIRDDRIELLVNLADRLSGTAFEALLLCGMEYLPTLTNKEYVRMFELANKRHIAFYRLTHFMRFHGRAPREVFRRFGADMDKLDGGGETEVWFFTGENEEMAAETWEQRIYKRLKISAEEIEEFRRTLYEFSL